MRWACLPFATWLVLTAGVTATALCQVPDSVGGPRATLVGRVIDTTGAAVADAQVVVTRASDSTTRTAMSNARGEVVISNLRPGGPYTILARKIGYGAARGSDIALRANDTLRVEFMLPAVALTLEPITVTARNRLSINAGQFDPRKYRDALDVIARYRRDMLGNPHECLPPGYEKPYLNVNIGRFTLGAGPVDTTLDHLKKQPWLRDLYTVSAFEEPPVPYVQAVYINGSRFDGSPLWVLRNIPADQIASLRYADCWDASMPLDMRYAIYVILKPSSRQVQDSILNQVQIGGRTRLYGSDAGSYFPKCKKGDSLRPDRSCRQKLKPTRAVLDSLMRSLREHDST